MINQWLILFTAGFCGFLYGVPGAYAAVISSSSTQYYFGDVTYYSPDGSIVFSRTTSLVKRTVNPSENTIVETVTQPPRTPTGRAVEFTMVGTLSNATTSTFTVTAPDSSYSGSMTYSGPEWKWTYWTYDINLKTGGKISGSGSLTNDGVKTMKTFYDEKGVMTALIHEDLKAISESRYNELKQELDSLPKTYPSQELYYYGTARILSLSDQTTVKQKVLLKKSMDPQEQSFSEIACVKTEDAPSLLAPIYMKVNGLRFAIYDRRDFTSDKLSGTGTLEGTPWNWEKLTFSMDYADGLRSAKIEDVNFVAGNTLIARKQLFLPNGKPFQLYEGELNKITRTEYDLLNEQLGCPNDQ